jgi:predicted permease
MVLLSRIISGLRRLFHKGQVEQELDEELREYLESSAERKIAAGLNREAALRAARVEIGSLEAVKERARDVGWESVVESLWQDVRYAIRLLRKSPAFTAVTILTLALGIGANTAIFSVVNSLLLRSLPVADPQRLVTVRGGFRDNQRSTWGGMNYPVWDQIRQRAHIFDGAVAWSVEGRFNITLGGETQVVDGVYVSGDFFTTLGVPAVVGRTFTSADDVPGGGPDGLVAVISYGLWQRRFGGAATVAGTPLIVDGVAFTIVGVTPARFSGVEVGQTFDVALPITTGFLIGGKDSALEVGAPLTAMLRLKPGQSIEAATVALRAAQPQIRADSRPPVPQQHYLEEPFTLVPAATGTSQLRQQYERPLVTILVLVALVLVVACANIANLLLARADARRHEFSVRLALGAPRWRLARQLLIESLVLACIGAAVGLIFAAWGSHALLAQVSTWRDQYFLDLSLDWRVLTFTAVVTSATAVLFGTAPAFHASRAAPINALKEHGRSGSGAARVSLSSGLVVGQVALSLVLVVAAGLFVRTFERLSRLPRGFDSEGVLVVTVDVTRSPIDLSNRIAFYQRLVDAVAAVPGVAHAAGSLHTPMGIGLTVLPTVNIPGAVRMREDELRPVLSFITPDWFATQGSAIQAGRDIDDHDTRYAPPVMLVNDAFVRRFFPGRDAIGATVGVAVGSHGETSVGSKTIVGVVRDMPWRSLRDDVPATMYVPLAQWNMPFPLVWYINISIRSSAGSPLPLARSVTAALTAVDREVALMFPPHLLADQVNGSLTRERLVATLSAFFGILALLLAGIGLYGVTAYAVSRRRHEIGIRIALGAQPADVIKLVLRQSVLLTVVGVALGVVSAAALTRYLEAMLFGVTPLDPSTFIVVSLLFGAVATVAAYVPARRATKGDPMIALRCE